MEEIFDDPRQFMIASGCKGTRTGRRKQPNRCSFLELIDYLWTDRVKEDGSPMKDSKPQIGKVRMNVPPIEDLDPEKLMNAILTAKEVTTNSDGEIKESKFANTAERGYVGGIDSNKLVAGSENWYDANKKPGISMNRSIQQFKKLSKAAEIFPEFPSLEKNGRESANLVVDLRKTDQNKVMAGLLSKFSDGRPIVTSEYKRVSNYGNPLTPDINKDATIASWQKQITKKDPKTGNNIVWEALSKDEAKEKYQEAEKKAKNWDRGRHQMAIDGSLESRRSINCA